MEGFSDNIFTKFLYEAPDDDPPDVVSDTGPPDVPDDVGSDDGPPDMGDSFGDDTPDSIGDDSGDTPPDMGDDFGNDDFGSIDEDSGDETSAEDDKEPLELDDKVSAVMNNNLYKNYMSLITKINSQLTSIRNNSDMLYTLSDDTQEVVRILEELDENIRIYIRDKFLNENYSKNLLFYNKCLNLLGLINIGYDKNIHKGIKEQK